MTGRTEPPSRSELMRAMWDDRQKLHAAEAELAGLRAVVAAVEAQLRVVTEWYEQGGIVGGEELYSLFAALGAAVTPTTEATTKAER